MSPQLYNAEYVIKDSVNLNEHLVRDGVAR
jgi:hypothetical protein